MDKSVKSLQIFNIDPTITISSTEMQQFDISDNNVNTETAKTYSKSDKKIIASRIEQIKNKKLYAKIFKTIYDDNNNYTLCNDGVFLNVNNLHDKTLTKIEKILDLYDNLKKSKTNKNKWTDLLNTQFNSNNTTTNISDDKLSNHEKMFLKRQQMNSDDDITYWGK